MKTFALLLALLPLALAAKPQSCGSRGLPECPTGKFCIADPSKPNCDPRADCPGICVRSGGPSCGGFTGKPCPHPRYQTCVDVPNDGCDPLDGGADCPGVCVRIPRSSQYVRREAEKALESVLVKRTVYPQCGGFAGTPCPYAGDNCVDDPRDNCDPKHGGADCIGICLGPSCGGFAGKKCPTYGQTCVDDPRDKCDPAHSGRDCIGVCIYDNTS